MGIFGIGGSLIRVVGVHGGGGGLLGVRGSDNVLQSRLLFVRGERGKQESDENNNNVRKAKQQKQQQRNNVWYNSGFCL